MIIVMRVLAARGGQLATVMGPTCSNPTCECTEHAINLDTGLPVDEVVVADREDFIIDDLRAVCAATLARLGWTDEDGELATMMADEAAEVAADSPVGTRLTPRFSWDEEDWVWYFIDDSPDDPVTVLDVIE